MTLYNPGPVLTRKPGNGITLVTSSPVHLHTVEIKAMRDGSFRLRLVSVWPVGEPSFKDNPEHAFKAAARMVNARTLSDWKTRFSGSQRYAMGRQKCPYAMYGKLCNQPADVGTVWCVHHPNGRTGDL